MEEMSLQQVRTIQVYDVRTGKSYNIETASNKWSEIIPLLKEKNISLTNTKAVLGSTKGVLELPDALIPAGNQQIILTVSKMNSGTDLSVLGYNELRRQVKQLGLEGLGSNPSKQALIDAIHGANKIEPKPKTKVAKAEKVEKVEKIIKEAKAATPDLTLRIEVLENALGTLIHGIYGVTLSFVRPEQVTPTQLPVQAPKGKPAPVPAEIQGTTDLLSAEELAKYANSILGK